MEPRDARVDAYLESLPPWQAQLGRRVREIAHAADPELVETIKRTYVPYFVLHGNVCALLGARQHLDVFVYDPDVPDPAGLINQGQGNATARAVQLREGEPLDETALGELLQAVAQRNRLGGWRRLRRGQ